MNPSIETTLGTVRERILHEILRVIVVVGGLALFAAVANHSFSSNNMPILVYTLMYAAAIFAAAWKSLPYPFRANVLLVIIFAGALSEYYFFGLTSLSFIFWYTLVLFTGLLFGLRLGLVSLGVALALMSAQVMYTARINAAEPSAFQGYVDVLLSWSSRFVSFAFLVASTLAALTYMLRSLESSNREALGLVTDLKLSEERYRLLAENAQDVIWTSDLEGRITYVSPSIERLTGYTPEEFPREQFGMGWDPAHLERTYGILADELAHDNQRDPKRSTIMDMQMRHKDGTLINAEVLSILLRDDDGKPNGILGVTRDVRERKRLELQLYQAQKMEAVGQLAGGIAHDFNNLLQVIHGYSEIALDELESAPETEQKIQYVMEASERARDLIDQLLAFSRQQVLELELLNPGVVVEELSAMIERLIGENIQITRDISDNLGGVLADRGQLEQVVMNLCVNARDAMGKSGELVLRVSNVSFTTDDQRTKPWSKIGDFVSIAVSDNGCGMDNATMQRIFEPFFTTKEQGKGTGLGLSTVFGIVNQHGGLIHVDSELGAGTTITVYLPIAAESAISNPAKSEQMPDGGSETILFVDDEEAVRGVGKAMLSKAGYNVLLADDGDEALRLIRELGDEIDLLMLDVVMPRTGGRAVAEQLADESNDIPIVFMSGYAGEMVHSELRLDAAENFIQKPYSRSALLSVVRNQLDSRKPSKS